MEISSNPISGKTMIDIERMEGKPLNQQVTSSKWSVISRHVAIAERKKNCGGGVGNSKSIKVLKSLKNNKTVTVSFIQKFIKKYIY